MATAQMGVGRFLEALECQHGLSPFPAGGLPSKPASTQQPWLPGSPQGEEGGAFSSEAYLAVAGHATPLTAADETRISCTLRLCRLWTYHTLLALPRSLEPVAALGPRLERGAVHLRQVLLDSGKGGQQQKVRQVARLARRMQQWIEEHDDGRLWDRCPCRRASGASLCARVPLARRLERQQFNGAVINGLTDRVAGWSAELGRQRLTRSRVARLAEALRGAERGTQAERALLETIARNVSRAIRRVEVEAGAPEAHLERIATRLGLALAVKRREEERLVCSNFRLVLAVAKRYGSGKLSFWDLVQEGNIGLLRATAKFDHRRGCRFSTLATWWIRQAISRALAEQSRTVRLPPHAVDQLRRFRRAEALLGEELMRRPTIEEVAERLGESPAALKELSGVLHQEISWDSPEDEEAEQSLSRAIGWGYDAGPLDELLRANLAAKLRQALRVLKPREREIILLRYGLKQGGELSRDEVAKKMKVSRERIRQLEEAALKRMGETEILAELNGPA